MAANENALTQPKFELGIVVSYKMCFRAILPQKQNLKNCWKKINYFPREGGGKFHENNLIFLEAFPQCLLHSVNKSSLLHTATLLWRALLDRLSSGLAITFPISRSFFLLDF